jgi:hypothetical protein
MATLIVLVNLSPIHLKVVYWFLHNGFAAILALPLWSLSDTEVANYFSESLTLIALRVRFDQAITFRALVHKSYFKIETKVRNAKTSVEIANTTVNFSILFEVA